MANFEIEENLIKNTIGGDVYALLKGCHATL